MNQYIEELEKFLEASNNEIKNLSPYEKFEYMLKNDKISISAIQRIFNYSYPKAGKIISDLIDCKAIEQQGNKYVVLSTTKYYDYVSNYTNESKQINYNGDVLSQQWLDFSIYKKVSTPSEFDLEKFKNLVKETCSYFQQLNILKNIAIASKEDISFHSCMRIITNMNFYASNKKITADCEYNDYNDLENYPTAKLQIIIKSTQLIAESLVFAISLIPKKQLSNIIPVIYNGETIDYDIQKENIEDIIKAICDFPYCEN